MIRRLHLSLSALFLLAACGGGGSPMAGNWSEVRDGDKPGMTLTFDGYSDKMSVHGRPQEDGTHTHPKATYTFDAETGALTVTGRILDGDKAESWSGRLADNGFELKGGETTLKFVKGGAAHGH